MESPPAVETSNTVRRFRRLTELAAACQFAGLLILAAQWWWMMPKGFPIRHPRFWMNSIVPPIVIIIAGWALLAILRSRHDLLIRLQTGTTALVSAAGITTIALFPDSITESKLLICLLMAFTVSVPLAVSVIWLFGNSSWKSASNAVAVGTAVGLGVFVPFSQHGSDPGTHPGEGEFRQPAGLLATDFPGSVSLGSHIRVEPFAATTVITSGTTSLQIEPVLQFLSISPDRFWTLFSPVHPALLRIGRYRRDTNEFIATYHTDHQSTLKIARAGDGQRIDFTANTLLKAPVYSHLNSFTRLYLFGSEPLHLSFAACPKLIEIKPDDYPVGRPARFATMTADGRLQVLEASSGEKGPFKVLTEGPLKRSDPLVMTLYNGSTPAFQITLKDWPAQASTQLSPTAGWGIPENAIEFSLGDDEYTAMIYFTLAGTSVGRGWDSVGHAPGTYRNRMTVEAIGARTTK